MNQPSPVIDAPVQTVEEQLLREIFEADNSDVEKLRHFWDKKDLDAQLLDPTLKIKALCGFESEKPVDPHAGGDICGACTWLFENVVGTNLPGGK